MKLFGPEKLKSGVKVFNSSMLFHFHLPLKNNMVTCVKTCVKTKLDLGRRRSNGSREEFDYKNVYRKEIAKHKHKYSCCAFSLAILQL